VSASNADRSWPDLPN